MEFDEIYSLLKEYEENVMPIALFLVLATLMGGPK